MNILASGSARRVLTRVPFSVFLLAVVCLAGRELPAPAAEAVAGGRREITLNGPWQFQTNGAGANWKTVQVPSSFESHEGIKFDGIGWYRKTIAPLKVPKGRRVLLHFQAAATEAQVWWNDHLLGTHLGGWTPFRFDVTDWIRQAPAGRPQVVLVRLDEKVGHNTQGFLPIIAPHFGGLWQEVKLVIVPDTYLDDLQLQAYGEVSSRRIRLACPLAGNTTRTVPQVALRYRLRGETNWTAVQRAVQRQGNVLRTDLPVPAPRLWQSAHPNLYEIELAIPGGDQVRTRAAFRSMEVVGSKLQLNGRPLSLRGLLNWGYRPPRIAPNPGEAAWRRELLLARACGFNMMKFCLWMPPRRYLELADELGVLTWMEYPTWHPQLTEQHWPELEREFREFFAYDRNHPSVVLRSLTCETGPSAELAVVRRLYDLAHRMIPGAVVEDDSSWIGWQRVHDFYDDHPYGNNHTWIATLQRLKRHIQAHGLKPLVLGEAMAADTWIDRAAVLPAIGDQRPFWAPAQLDAQTRWLARLEHTAGAAGLDALLPDSLRYAMHLRKYQVETYRREVPDGGYVVSVIRDIPKASMGLVDYLGQPKWPAADWSWHGETMCLLQTAGDRRGFAGGKQWTAEIWCSHFGELALARASLEVTLSADGAPQALKRWTISGLSVPPGTLKKLLAVKFQLPEVKVPTRCTLQAVLRAGGPEFRNAWPLWLVPERDSERSARVRLHSSVSLDLATNLFPGAMRLRPGATGRVVVASRFDDALVRVLESGGRVLFLPDGQTNSFPLQAHWFLRGGPYLPGHPVGRQVPRELLVDLQQFDLAGEVIPQVDYLEAIDPILLLWDTHDLTTVRQHALIFETRAGAGRLLVSALKHGGATNAVGNWLLDVLLDHLQHGPSPRHALPASMWSFLKSKLHAEQINLTPHPWRFRPDPNNVGLQAGWHRPKLDAQTGWHDIQIGAAWEGQGYPNLDHWAWYRRECLIPKRWRERPVFLSFEGVDDIYELYVNGQLAGKGGDLATRKDAFNERKSHDITRYVQPGQKAVLAVRVHDWYGAGGIFRPVTLGTIPLRPELELLK